MQVVVIGGGLIGLGSALAIQQMFHDANVVVCEKESAPGAHQSSHNSGVLHAGLYYVPGSFKAKLAVRGIRLMTAFAAEHRVRHEICGKIVVATEDAEIPRLRTLHERGMANGLRGLEWLGPDAAREHEPNVRAVAAVRVPEEGIIDYPGVVQAMREVILAAGGRVLTNAPVTAAQREGSRWRLTAGGETLQTDVVVNCAGLQSDRVARLFGERPATRIVPFRGDYFLLGRPQLVRHLIYPVPDPAFPFLGVHFTRMIGGGVECGPTAVLALAREGYSRTTVNPGELWATLTNPGVLKVMARYWRTGLQEVLRSFSKRRYTQSLQRLVPAVTRADLLPRPPGIRAQAVSRAGALVDDFLIRRRGPSIHVLNAPSPAATAALNIGKEIAAMV